MIEKRGEETEWAGRVSDSVKTLEQKFFIRGVLLLTEMALP